MAWMIGRNHCTVPTGRLQLGSRTNLNVHYEKTTINNFGGGMGMMGMNIYSPMMNMGMMGMNMYSPMMNMGMMGMDMYSPMMNMGMMGMDMYSPMMGLYGGYYGDSAGATTTIVGSIINSVGQLAGMTGQIINAKKSQPSEETESSKKEESTTNAEIKEQIKKLQAANQKRLEELQELKEQSKLYQEGITMSSDGSYVAKVKDKDGNEIELKGETLAEIRKLKKDHEASLA